MPDPAFTGLSLSDVTAGVQTYGPEGVEVVAVTTETMTETTARTTVEWAHEGGQDA